MKPEGVKAGTALFVAALAVTLLVAVVVSQFASGNPDGLEYVAEEQGFADAAEDHALEGHVLADYGGDSRGYLALAGVVGVLATLGLSFVIFWLARSREPDPASSG